MPFCKKYKKKEIYWEFYYTLTAKLIGEAATQLQVKPVYIYINQSHFGHKVVKAFRKLLNSLLR